MTQDTIKDRLRSARALIAKPEHWTQDANKRSAAGNVVRTFDIPVASRCSFGALMEVCDIGEEGEVAEHLARSIKRHNECAIYGLSDWNDAPERTHTQVILAFDRAIEDASDADQA